MKKRTNILVMALVLIVALVGAAVGFASYISHYKSGVVTQISIKEKKDNTAELQIKYLCASGGYSVSAVDETEGEYTGDGMTDYDGALGKYRILIEFGDVALEKSFKKDGNEFIQFSKDLRGKVATPSGHGFVLYIGCDKPISVEQKNGIKLNSFAGTIKIPITIER